MVDAFGRNFLTGLVYFRSLDSTTFHQLGDDVVALDNQVIILRSIGAEHSLKCRGAVESAYFLLDTIGSQ